MRRLIRIPLGPALALGVLLVGLTNGPPEAQAAAPGVLITEFQAANTRTVADDQGRYSDWIELHNPTDTPVSLAGYTLTDDPAEPTKWSLPAATLAPGDFLVIWASGLDQVTPEGWHTSFRLSRGGEYVGLFGPDGQVVDEVTFGTQETDVSLGRLGTESDQWVSFPNPTPGAANTTTPRAAADAPPVLVIPGSGMFAGPVTVQLEAPVAGSTVYYTLDGADPTVEGQEYTAPLAVTETTVLRTVALDAGVPVSSVTTATYLVGESTGLPVLSLVTDPAHLWDEERGIYVNPQERGRDWERPVTIEWLSPEGEVGFSVGAGLRLHGGGSRRGIDQAVFPAVLPGSVWTAGVGLSTVWGGNGDRPKPHHTWPYPCGFGRVRDKRMIGWCCGREPMTVGSAGAGRGVWTRRCTCGTSWSGSCTRRWARWQRGAAGWWCT